MAFWPLLSSRFYGELGELPKEEVDVVLYSFPCPTQQNWVLPLIKLQVGES